MLPNREPKTALVLSGGGLFGAYQAGVWAALAPEWQPDLVIGASVGALNGWAIASGIAPVELVARWRSLGRALSPRWQIPRSFLDGVADSGPVREHSEALYREFRPKTEYGLTLTTLPKPRPLLVTMPDVTADHLMASCAIPGVYRQCRLDGKICSDGGLLQPLPLWAAASLGATRIVAINALSTWPWFLRALTRACGTAVYRQVAAPDVPMLHIGPAVPLGTRLDSIIWSRDNIERWVELGYQDGSRVRSALTEHPGFVRSY